MHSDRDIANEYLSETPILDFGGSALSSSDFNVTTNPMVLRAYGLMAGQTVQVWMTAPDHLGANAESPFSLDGATMTLSMAENVKIIPYPGIYFLKLSSGAGNCKVTGQQAEMARAYKKPNLITSTGGTGLTPAQQAQLAMAHPQNTDSALATGTSDFVTAADLRQVADAQRETVLSGAAVTSGRLVKIVNGVALPTSASDNDIMSRPLGITESSASGPNQSIVVAFLGRITDTSYSFASGIVYAPAAIGPLGQSDPGIPNHYVVLGYSEGGNSFVFNPSARVARN